MSPRTFATIAAPVAVCALVALGGTHATAGDDAADLLERSRDAASQQTFAGVVEVRWQQGRDQEVAQVGARSVGGAFVVGRGTDHVVGAGARRWAGDDQSMGWSADVGDLPSVDRTWDLEVVGSRQVAGRDAALVVARDDDGQVRARFAVDRATGQLLHREILDRDGGFVRSVTFLAIVTDGVAPAVPAVPGADASAPEAIDDVPRGYDAPSATDGGYALVGRYRHPDGVVQLYYDDGLFSVSLFEQRGLLDWDQLPVGGVDSAVDGVRTRSYATPEGHVTVWADGDLVLTSVADGPPEAGADFVRAVSGKEDDVVDDVVDFVLGPFGWE